MSNIAPATNGVATKEPPAPKAPAPTHALQMVAMGLIVASKTNPRKYFDDAALRELAASIKEHGVLQAVLLRPITEKGQRRYEIVDGERRYRATKLAELSEIPANVRDLSDRQVAEMQIIANLLRADLTPLEEADGFARMVRELGYKPAEVADRIHKSATYVLRHLKMADLAPKLRNLVEVGTLPVGHALLLARIPDHKLQMDAYKEIQDSEWYDGERVDVLLPLKQATKKVSEDYMLDLSKVTFDLTDKVLVPAAGSCTECQYRSGNARDLFDDVKSKDICTKPPCYQAKVAAWYKALEGEKLPIAKTDDVFWTHGDLKGNSAYIDIETKPNGTSKTIEKIVAGEVPTVLALDPTGKLRKLADAKAVARVLLREKITTRTPDPYARPKKTAAQKEKDQREALQAKIEERVVTGALKLVGAGVEKVADSNYFQTVLMLFRYGFGFGRFGFLRSQGVKSVTHSNVDARWEQWVLGLKRTQYRSKLFELMMFAVYDDGVNTQQSKALFNEICVLCKIDDAALRREATTALAPKSAKATATAKAAKPKKGGKRVKA